LTPFLFSSDFRNPDRHGFGGADTGIAIQLTIWASLTVPKRADSASSREVK